MEQVQRNFELLAYAFVREHVLVNFVLNSWQGMLTGQKHELSQQDLVSELMQGALMPALQSKMVDQEQIESWVSEAIADHTPKQTTTNRPARD